MPDEHREATEAAAKHRQQAGELYAQHRSEGRDELLDQARQEDSKAAHFEEKARGGGGQKKDTFQRDGEASGDTERRAWYAPGSVADDKLLSFEEAKQGGILDQVTLYAARSVFDKDHRKFEGPKAVGKGAKAVGKGTRAVGEKSARAVGKSAKAVGKGAKAVGKGAKAVGEKGAKAVSNTARAVGRGARAGKGASSPLEAARDYAASRRSKAGPSTGDRQKNAGRKAPARKQKTQSQQRQSPSKGARPQREPER